MLVIKWLLPLYSKASTRFAALYMYNHMSTVYKNHEKCRTLGIVSIHLILYSFTYGE